MWPCLEDMKGAIAFFLKYLNYADDICLLSYQVMGFGQKVLDLEKEASRVVLKIKTHKIKVLSLTGFSFYFYYFGTSRSMLFSPGVASDLKSIAVLSQICKYI